MIVTLYGAERFETVILPEKAEGEYSLSLMGSAARLRIEGLDGKWMLMPADEGVQLIHSGQPSPAIELAPPALYALRLAGPEKAASVYAEKNDPGRQLYAKYLTEEGAQLTIGRTEGCDIRIQNSYVSSRHATLRYQGERWHVEDEGSSNGTFVNGVKVQKAVLAPGDVVAVMGVRIAVFAGVLAMNNPNGTVRASLKRLEPQPLAPTEKHRTTVRGERFFYRALRIPAVFPSQSMQVDAPPQSQAGEETPMALVLGPSVTMGLSAVTTGLVSVTSAMSGGNPGAAVPSVVMTLSMLAGSILWPTMSRRYDRERRQERETRRQSSYSAYLSQVEQEIARLIELQRSARIQEYPSVQDCLNLIERPSSHLWDHTVDTDRLSVRLGLGTLPLEADIRFPEKRFTMDQDALSAKLRALADKPKLVQNTPVALPIRDVRVAGFSGPRERLTDMGKRILIQLVSLYGYDELKLVLIYNPEDNAEFDDLRWLPHVRSEEAGFRFLATDADEVKELDNHFRLILERRAGASAEKSPKPEFVFLIFDRETALHANFYNRLFERPYEGVHVLCFAERQEYLAKETEVIVDMGEGESVLYDKRHPERGSVRFMDDESVRPSLRPYATRLSNVRLNLPGTSAAMPDMLRFLELYGVGKIENLNILTRWRENNPAVSLKTPVGVDEAGQPLLLDLHEKFHGPHGLVAGMTGSGKSEFIMTYILSMAVNYSPDEVAFMLIDYKGGGMAKAFEKLPHTVGIITNLDGSSVKRSLVSLESELRRRQALLVEAGQQAGNSNMDIYGYQRMHREKAVKKPLPHLFVIADEFAELKTQQGDFMEQLISAARIGRSLGVHLILATQKPSGVVDDQIWSNSRFRVCLKVQERADSMDVLKRPDAAELKRTGRFYLQVGYNEQFLMGQSAWAGCPYAPAERPERKADTSVEVINRNALVLRHEDRKDPGILSGKLPKLMDSLVAYLEGVARQEGISAERLWLPPMPPVLSIGDLESRYIAGAPGGALESLVGEMDDPERQRKLALKVPLSDGGHVLVYGATGSGKTQFLFAFLYSLMKRHTPDELHLYLVDLSSGALRAFVRAPHVGDVVLFGEDEKLKNLLRLLSEEISRRRGLLQDAGTDFAGYVKAGRGPLPAIVVAINNYAPFREQYDVHEDALAGLIRDGQRYGVHFVVTAAMCGDMRYNMAQLFAQNYVLQMNNTDDYTMLLGRTDGLLPAKYPGRGMTRRDGKLYEFQCAALSEGDPFGFAERFSDELSASWHGVQAMPVPVLPERVDAQQLLRYARSDGQLVLPVGIDTGTLKPAFWNLEERYISLCLSEGGGQDAFADAVAKLVKACCPHEVFRMEPDPAKPSATAEGARWLYDTVLERNNAYKDAIARGKAAPEFKKALCILRSAGEIFRMLSEEDAERFRLALEKGAAPYGLRILLMDTPNALKQYLHAPWFKQHLSGRDGLYIGDGFSSQILLTSSKVGSELARDIGSDHGWLLTGGKPKLIKLPTSEEVV